ncbi:hypothetical protein F4805DRAFT_368836 [Annulohypoxylon moriforme]|nr:hypothetical protein F4805DRAFT_368836 [Annulohypoxylon moriforme]
MDFTMPRKEDKPDPNSEAGIKHYRDILRLRGLHTEETGEPLAELAQAVDDEIVDLRVTYQNPALTFEPFYFFFYGSLQHPTVLKHVTRMRERQEPVLKPGSIKEWEMMMWSQYPALVPKEGSEVKGMYWKCERIEDVSRLCMYETDAYRMEFCDITTEEGEVIKDGRIFVSTFERGELREGSFDLKRFMRDMP